MLWKETHDDQLFVFWNGKLIYKRWLSREISVVFNSFGIPSWGEGRSVNLDGEEANERVRRHFA